MMTTLQNLLSLFEKPKSNFKDSKQKIINDGDKKILARVNEFVATLFANFSLNIGRENMFLKSFHPKQCFEELPPHRAKRVCE